MYIWIEIIERNLRVRKHLLNLHKYSRAALNFYHYCCYLQASWLVHCELLNCCCIYLQEHPPQITADLRGDQQSPD